MDRFAAMLILLGLLVSLVLVVVALFTVAPIICSCLVSLLYSLYLFMAYEENGGAVQNAGQEFENRFWTVFALLLSSALLFAKDSPIAIGLWYSPSIGLCIVLCSGYSMHLWDRHQHRIAISQQARIPRLRTTILVSNSKATATSSHRTSPVLSKGNRKSVLNSNHNTSNVDLVSNSSNNNSNNSLSSNNQRTSGGSISNGNNSSISNNTSGNGINSNHSSSNTFLSSNQQLHRLHELGIPVQMLLDNINSCLMEIDQQLIPSTINNFINQRFVLTKEREIITIFESCDARALNYILCHVKLGLLFYKIKDHNYFNGKNRTELISLLAIERLPILTVISRVILLHSLQLLKLRAHPRAEDWVRNIFLNTHQDELSELKTLTDAKGDYFCMNKLIYDDIRSESIRQDILNHIRREATILQTHMLMGTRRRLRRYQNTNTNTITSSNDNSQYHYHHQNHHHPDEFQQLRKILSDVDDTLCSSGGMYPAGIDKRYPKKTVYPGVLAFYRELDLGYDGPDEWTDDRVGNLVFLSARPHVYKDMSEKRNFAKFERLRATTIDGRKGLHTMPSLLAGDLSSGSQYIVTNDFEPLAQKKFDNFRRYVSIYPEYQHIFVCDNGQGDVRAAELMYNNFPYEFEQMYCHIVQPIDKTYGYKPNIWYEREFKPCFFRTYPEAALHAAYKQKPPLICTKAVQRICYDSVKDFEHITNWTTIEQKNLRRLELNQGIWLCNVYLIWYNEQPVPLIVSQDRKYTNGLKVRTPYGIATICNYDPIFDLYSVELDWRPITIQYNEYLQEVKNASIKPRKNVTTTTTPPTSSSSCSNTTGSTTTTGGATAATASALTITTTTTTTASITRNASGPLSSRSLKLSTVVESNIEDEEIVPGTAGTITTNTTTGTNVSMTGSCSSDHDDSTTATRSINEPVQQQSQHESNTSTTTTDAVPTVVQQQQQEIGEPSGERAGLVSQQQSQLYVDTSSTVDSSHASSSSAEPSDRNPQNDTETTTTSATGGRMNILPSPVNSINPETNIILGNKVYAQISGRYITKYTPPVLPKFDHHKSASTRSIFPFLSSKKSDSSVSSSSKKVVAVVYKVGDKWSTPYGLVKIAEYREKSMFVVVDMIGWNARAYLKQELLLKKATQSSILGTLLRQLSSAGTSTTISETIEKKPPIFDYPYPESTVIQTPYGKGIVSRPLPRQATTKQQPQLQQTLQRSDVPKRTKDVISTVGISLQSWKLANGKCPTLYATVETTKRWKEAKIVATTTTAGASIFSTLGTLVTSSRTLLEPLFTPPLIQPPKPPTMDILKVLFKRYYKDAAAVSTPFGDGRVVRFRDVDGFYEIHLTKWSLADGRHPSVFLREDDISHLISKGCLEGYPVYTNLGLTGRLVSVEPTTGIHIVTLPYAGIICYLQPDSVSRPIKACVNDEVFTLYGNGKVIRYNPVLDNYAIKLTWDATLYCKDESFDRVADGIPDEEARFGVNWLLSFFYQSDSSTLTRSRSNSLVSSNRSVT